MKQDLIECKIVTFSQDVLHRKVSKVEFNSLRDGIIQILPMHIEQNFLICPGKMVVYGRDMIRNYFHGVGTAKVTNHSVSIFASQIFLEDEYESFMDKFLQSENFSESLVKTWERLKSK